ncbi:MAG: HAMP domain-containing histidine kinase [Alphaproteobacteria bacterium]|nr:HAMP domain-containing histidine kinase [Alphaproteobacteria bacterium]MBU6473133.1 HAMP domain-containing histidine kinase [Alphaproteobacteria bacterium]MDE2011511.1 HAMP domain-containing histidine kinase [Alphaproteobacteria bacterium]MDE2071902.1 HAMP domain-containing histidine kinase [Alphaproteobacteria bacterium]MDE2350378.1 HAMP domain-containing histidine kinase [Alphaproteobacteria bacterium]
MRTIKAKLTLFYALSATITLACLFVAGYVLLESRLIHGLDLLNEAEFDEIQAHLGNDYEHLSTDAIDRRIRETTQYASVLFYVNLHNRKTHDLFYSSNLNRQIIPDVPGQHIYNTSVPHVGELRVAEFVLHGYDVTVGTPLAPIRAEMRIYVEVSLALLAGMLLASIAIGFGLSRVMLQPIRTISATADRIRSDNLSERIPVADVHDEIADLGRLLNQMFDRLEVAFNEVRRFAADASHELKTPLSLVRLQAEKLLVDGRLAPEHEDVMIVLLDEIGRLNRIVDELLFLSRAEAHAIPIETTLQDPRPFLEAFRQDAQVLAEHQNKRFDFICDGDGMAAFNERWLRQVLLNLLTNALNASPVGAAVLLRTQFAGKMWRVSMEDRGPGLPPEQRQRMFERFVRFGNQGDDRGTGLGLAICRSMIELMGGHIHATAGPGDIGLCSVFELPAQPLAHAAAGAPGGAGLRAQQAEPTAAK